MKMVSANMALSYLLVSVLYTFDLQKSTGTKLKEKSRWSLECAEVVEAEIYDLLLSRVARIMDEPRG